MFTEPGVHTATHRPLFRGTFWHCEKCGSFISLHSAEAVEDLPCPVCSDEMMVFCTSFDSGFELTIAQA